VGIGIAATFARLRATRALRRHHERHHAPERRWNFNVTVPLWDVLRGTLWSAGEDARDGGEAIVRAPQARDRGLRQVGSTTKK
jgi:sterol desaturase/sphingolipid hydroxylase (fatty acid hydroxylase superfamily)